jgi:RNA recognition motif-containing protein
MGTKVYVGNVNYTTSEDDLRELFADYGDVVNLRMVTDRDTGRYRGFSFVEFGSEEAAQSAIESLNGTELDGRKLVVNEAIERQDRQQKRRF